MVVRDQLAVPKTLRSGLDVLQHGDRSRAYQSALTGNRAEALFCLREGARCALQVRSEEVICGIRRLGRVGVGRWQRGSVSATLGIEQRQRKYEVGSELFCRCVTLSRILRQRATERALQGGARIVQAGQRI